MNPHGRGVSGVALGNLPIMPKSVVLTPQFLQQIEDARRVEFALVRRRILFMVHCQERHAD